MKNYNNVIENGATICYNKKASSLTSIKTGGYIDTLIIPTSEAGLLVALDNTSEDRLVLGGWTNTLVSDSGIREEVITTTKCKGIKIAGDRLICSAGESVANVASVAKKNSLSGMEGLCGVFGSIAGAVVMNASAYDSEMADIVESVKVWRRGEILELGNEEINFGYRDTIFLHNSDVILSVTLQLNKTNGLLITKAMRSAKSKRANSQPTEPSLGSVFKKVGDISAGYYIEGCGLKGRKMGGCAISQKHANFIVNLGDGKSQDYMDLMILMQDGVAQKYNITLASEVRLVGEFERKIQDNS